MEKLKSGKSGKITNKSKSKKTLLRSKPVKYTINLLKIFGISYRLKLIRH